jgi:hypothetical protein
LQNFFSPPKLQQNNNKMSNPEIRNTNISNVQDAESITESQLNELLEAVSDQQSLSGQRSMGEQGAASMQLQESGAENQYSLSLVLETEPQTIRQ